jgi:hypothetical protein
LKKNCDFFNLNSLHINIFTFICAETKRILNEDEIMNKGEKPTSALETQLKEILETITLANAKQIMPSLIESLVSAQYEESCHQRSADTAEREKRAAQDECSALTTRIRELASENERKVAAIHEEYETNLLAVVVRLSTFLFHPLA